MSLLGITAVRDSAPLQKIDLKIFFTLHFANAILTNSHQLKFMCKCRFSAEKLFVCCTAFPVKTFDLTIRQTKLKMHLHRAVRSNQGNYYLRLKQMIYFINMLTLKAKSSFLSPVFLLDGSTLEFSLSKNSRHSDYSITRKM